MVTFSAFVKNIAGQYFYIYQNRDYNKPIFSNSCIMFQQSNVYYNLAFTYVTTIEADSLSFQVYDTADYPC